MLTVHPGISTRFELTSEPEVDPSSPCPLVFVDRAKAPMSNSQIIGLPNVRLGLLAVGSTGLQLLIPLLELPFEDLATT